MSPNYEAKPVYSQPLVETSRNEMPPEGLEREACTSDTPAQTESHVPFKLAPPSREAIDFVLALDSSRGISNYLRRRLL